MATLPDVLSPTMNHLLECANGALIEADAPVGRAFLNPGLDVPWDDCCDGQLWVRVLQVYPSGTQGIITPDSTAANCNPKTWTAQLGVGVLRCAKTVDDNGVAPTASEMTAEALDMTRDMALLETAIRCCWQPPFRQFVFERWVPLGVQGGCVGGEWTLYVPLQTCACPDDAPGPVPVGA